MDLHFLCGVTNNIHVCFLDRNFRTLSWILLMKAGETPRRGSFSCSRNASFHVRVLPVILAAVVRLFKIRKSTFLLFVCPRYNVTWLRPCLQYTADSSVFVFVQYEKKRLPNMNKSFTHIEKRGWPRIWPRRFSALNPSPRSWIFTSVSVDSSPGSY